MSRIDLNIYHHLILIYKMEQPEKDEILVSVLCQAYNHEASISQCLDGFIMQKTNFKFEILIHDDASTDNTACIIKEYELKYPDLIKPIYQTVNQYSQKKKVFSKIQMPRATSKYMAICEGDDYWTDALKLQKQVDFLENNDEYSACTHQFDLFKNQNFYLSRKVIGNVLTLEDLTQGVPFQFATIMMRREWICIPTKYENYIQDTFIYMLLAEKGPIYHINKSMSVYRKHSGGIWSGLLIEERITKQISQQNKRIEYFIDHNPKIAYLLKKQLANDLTNSSIRCIRKGQILSSVRLFIKSYKYSRGKRQIQTLFSFFLGGLNKIFRRD